MPSRKTPQSAVMNTREAALYVGLAKSTLEKLRIYGNGELPHVKLGSSVRYLKTDLDKWLANSVRKHGARRGRRDGRNKP